MFNDYNEITERNKAVIAMMVNMAESDNDLNLAEQDFILDIAYRTGLTGDEVEEIFSYPDRFILKPPQNEEDRMALLYYLLFLMRIDGAIEKKEEDYCFKMGLKLGFNHQMVADLIHVMKHYLHEELPEDALIIEVRKYLN